MKIIGNANQKSIMGVLAGILIGVAGTAAIHAQQPKPAPAYAIAEENVSDPATFQIYADKVPATLAPFGGHYLARGGKMVAAEGDAPKRFVIIAFDSLAQAQGWWNSPAYDAIKDIRHKASKSTIFIVEGVNP